MDKEPEKDRSLEEVSKNKFRKKLYADQIDPHEMAVSSSGCLRFLGGLLFGVPLLVILINFVFGWVFAVLAMPLLLIFVFKQSGASNRNNRKKSPVHFRVIGILQFLVMILIPATAVTYDNQDIMRLWALGSVIIFIQIFWVISSPDATDIVKGKEGAVRLINAFGCSVLTALFLGISELLWWTTGFGGWVIFHAFGLQFLLVSYSILLVLLQTVMVKNGITVETVIRSQTPVEREPNDQSIAYRMKLIGNHEVVQFGTVSFSQILHILGECKANDVLAIRFNMYSRAEIRHSEHGIGIDIDLSIAQPTEKSVFVPPIKQIKAERIPREKLDPILSSIWSAEWGEVEEKLSAYRVAE